ncbi:Uncharacterised protein [Campylobacter hyointestinalis subsp. hyointestinalis]|uniref:Uncharacterized protein n=2 Tax=Campylobacter hyointestinalis TaxID=198 RepID=A0A9W5ANJ6_CAMHY|nr:hypothetical protein [Campylobacter hyointestinalis]CUU70181.1 Uncharacterised protein [Campylobacter hyointestinalis subsp. hyointestinalis]CUU70189.1 Uncharacterised protein [Campylobacter hyointestinalis subsp. hyointestinalis]CUU75391.1 Uncharacterised protein [Campylobacter hyointestinalis subsp. hyointestinalis]CUU75460.1 Uncharacterised protein [Campylobacter hyointestinalis subsp. hyointestinalis]CUU76599.1 Uncharacterised protein [Campylobacter hyointestinalis subsp. hyointestinali
MQALAPMNNFTYTFSGEINDLTLSTDKRNRFIYSFSLKGKRFVSLKDINLNVLNNGDEVEIKATQIKDDIYLVLAFEKMSIKSRLINNINFCIIYASLLLTIAILAVLLWKI